jgi:hypothetical protein
MGILWENINLSALLRVELNIFEIGVLLRIKANLWKY